jgi:uracil-DNA glycosylase
MFSLDEVHPSWRPLFAHQQRLIDSILEPLSGIEIAPAREKVFRAFTTPLEEIRVVIFGQDPYPGIGVADGLAFSSSAENKVPPSLRNIFKELSSDLGIPIPLSPDLSPWSRQGILLLNRTLTTVPGSRNAHLEAGWRHFTLAVAQYLSQHNVVAILWGNYAQELSPLFTYRIESPHPSPLSARRGFFGSKPFSRANQILRDNGEPEVDWSLS